MNRFTTVLFRIGFGIVLIALIGGIATTGVKEGTIGKATLREVQPSAAAYPPRALNPDSTLVALSEQPKMSDPEQIIAAEVLLRPASGAAITGNTIITSETIANYRPAPESGQLAAQFFRDQGFEVSPITGIGFTIRGTAARFSELFKTTLIGDTTIGIQAMSDASTTSEALPLNALPSSVTDSISAVTFSPPPDFGPTQFNF